MRKPVGRIIGQLAGISASVAIAGAGIVALRHALETPQPLKSVLPGEAHLYRWRRRSIFYKVAGSTDAPPLVLLHRPDLGASGHEMLPIMSPLAQTYRVYAFDLLGFGLSDRPGVEYSADLYSALCQDFLREVVQRPATLVASGLSCNYAVATAAHTPELCESLVLISPLALQGNSQSFSLSRYVEKPPIKALLYPLLSTRLAFLLTRENREDFSQFYANTHQLGAEHAVMARLAGKLVGNIEHQFEALQQPVLMIWGTHALDNQHIVASLHRTAVLANPARQARKVELIQEAALAAHDEQPEAVITAIQRWQEEIRRGQLSSLTETPACAHHTADQQETHTPVVLVASEQRTSPIQTQNTFTQTSLSAPSQADKARTTAEGAAIAAPETAATKEAIETTAVAAEASDEIAKAQAEAAGDNQESEPEIMAYCVKCKQKRKMLNAREVTMKNGRPAMRGVCPVCGTRLNRIGSVS